MPGWPTPSTISCVHPMPRQWSCSRTTQWCGRRWRGRFATVPPRTGTSMWRTARSPRSTRTRLARDWSLSTTPATYRAAKDEPAGFRRDPTKKRPLSGPASRSFIGDAHLWSDAAALTDCSSATRSLSARNCGKRWVSVIFHHGGDPIVVSKLDRRMCWLWGVRLAGAQVRHCSSGGERDENKSAAGANVRNYGSQVRCVRETRALEVRCIWPQHTSEPHPNRGRQPTVAARVTDDQAAVGRTLQPVEH